MKKDTKALMAQASLHEVNDVSDADLETQETLPLLGMANPASIFCLQQGGQLEMVNTPEGQVGYCLCPDGQRIEEWTYFKSHQKDNTLS